MLANSKFSAFHFHTNWPFCSLKWNCSYRITLTIENWLFLFFLNAFLFLLTHHIWDRLIFYLYDQGFYLPLENTLDCKSMRFFKERRAWKETMFIEQKPFVSQLSTLTSRLLSIYVQNPSRFLLLLSFSQGVAVRLLCHIITFDLKIIFKSKC